MSGPEASSTSFLLSVEPGWVTPAGDPRDLDDPGSLRAQVDQSVAGDLIGFEPALASPIRIELYTPIEGPDPVANLLGGNIHHNEVEAWGGGIYIGDRTVVSVGDVSINDNVAGEGGGVWMSRDPMPEATLLAFCETLSDRIVDNVPTDVDGAASCP